MLVILFHSGEVGFAGGFVGVSVFFVLSGFLVTGVLLEEIGNEGRIRLDRFYARRIRRLLPAASVFLLTVGVGSLVVYSPLERISILADIRAAALYFANWRFIAEATDYFGSEISASPILHFWSLSIEEQFYFVWPLLLWGGFLIMARRARDPYRALGRAVIAVAAISTLAALLVGADDLMRAYYGTDLRAYQLLVGVALAAFIRAERRARSHGLLRTLPLLAVLLMIVGSSSLLPAGVFTRELLATAAAAGFIWSTERSSSLAARLLERRVPVYVGKISYGIYLWHWPVALTLIRAEVEPLPRVLLVTGISIGLAAASYRWIEQPVRTSVFLRRRDRSTIVFGLATSVLVGGLTTVGIVRSGAEAVVDWRAAAEDTSDQVRCINSDLADCVITQNGSPHLMVIGDSYAAHWLPSLKSAAEKHGFTLSSASLGNCPWVLGVAIDLKGEPHELCHEFMDDAVSRVVPGLSPDIVLLISADLERRPVIIGGEVFAADTPEHTNEMTAGAMRTIEQLVSRGIQVGVAEMIPVAGYDVPGCLSTAESVNECDFVDEVGTQPVEKWLQANLREIPNATMLNLDDIVCPAHPKCEAVTADGMVTRADGGHMTTAYASTLADELLARIEAELDIVFD